MCLIVDANLLSAVFATPPMDEMKPVRDALFTKRARAVYGGKLAKEYAELKRLAKFLAELDRQRILRLYPRAEVDAAEEEVVNEGRCVSNDPHVIGLARVSGTRLLCSHDVDLHADFTNPAILRSAGNVYQTHAHKHLIVQHCRPQVRPSTQSRPSPAPVTRRPKRPKKRQRR
jgi:hypothetical protein